jgi:glyoxylase-like metal-dependent hydrolase (beta-lactamase superfamily II)
MRKVSLFATLFVLAAVASAQQAPDFSKVEIKVTKVAGSVYMLQGFGGNIGVSVGDDGILIVDDQYAPLADKIKAALKGIADKPVKFVLNTHWHGDHTGGNAQFGETVPIIAHENVRKRLQTGGTIRAFNMVTPPAAKGALPVITFEDKVMVHFNGEDIRAIHFPKGHTDGDIVVFFPQSNVVHMGDDFFAGMFPFVDLDSGGSVKGLIADIAQIISMLPPDVKIIPGHGSLSTLDDLKKFEDMLRGTSAAVEDAIKQGKTLDQMKQEKVLAKYADWAKGFLNADRFTEILYNDLSGKKTGAFLKHN